MVKIRLTRVGRQNRPLWRIGVFDSKTRRDGRPIEYLGFYDPKKEKIEDKVQINRERVQHWLSKGAQPTPTIASMIKQLGIAR